MRLEPERATTEDGGCELVSAGAGHDRLSAGEQVALLFGQERIHDALALALRTWACGAEHLDALAWAVRLRLYLGDEGGAHGLCTPLLMEAPRGLGAAVAQLQSLLLLARNQDVWDQLRRARDCRWFDSGSARGRALMHHLGACAARRLGQERHARILWRDALRLAPDLAIAEANLEPVRASDLARLPDCFELSEVLPLAWLERLRPGMPVAAAPGPDQAPSNAYLRAIYIAGTDEVRRLAVLLLVARARQGDADARRALTGLAGVPAGTPDERLSLLLSLSEEGLLAADEPADYWDGYELRRIRPIDAWHLGVDPAALRRELNGASPGG